MSMQAWLRSEVLVGGGVPGFMSKSVLVGVDMTVIVICQLVWYESRVVWARSVERIEGGRRKGGEDEVCRAVSGVSMDHVAYYHAHYLEGRQSRY